MFILNVLPYHAYQLQLAIGSQHSILTSACNDLQIKHAKIARELEAAEISEKGLSERVSELEEEVRDVSSTCRSRIRWLEQAADQAKRRVEQLFRELQASAPLTVRTKLPTRDVQLKKWCDIVRLPP